MDDEVVFVVGVHSSKSSFFAFSLLERRCAPGCDGVAPSTSEGGHGPPSCTEVASQVRAHGSEFCDTSSSGVPSKKKNHEKN